MKPNNSKNNKPTQLVPIKKIDGSKSISPLKVSNLNLSPMKNDMYPQSPSSPLKTDFYSLSLSSPSSVSLPSLHNDHLITSKPTFENFNSTFSSKEFASTVPVFRRTRFDLFGMDGTNNTNN